ncbi:hypothetical protein [Streptomyces decoyicus]|uniref:hypothetical protein n=1 Tax=Streptomyces decoyicus TaxID=249567 RepID=UPI003665A045
MPQEIVREDRGVDLVLGERDEEGGQVAFEVEPFLAIECGGGEGPARGLGSS